MSIGTVPRKLTALAFDRGRYQLSAYTYINQALQIFLNKLCVLRPHGPSLKMALKITSKGIIFAPLN